MSNEASDIAHSGGTFDKPTPITARNWDPVERAFQLLAQRELRSSRMLGSADESLLSIQLVAAARLALTDDRGRKTVVDDAADRVREDIPQSSCERW